MIHGINGRPYIDLDPYLDVKSLVSLHEDVAYGIAKSYLRIGAPGPEIKPGEGRDLMEYTQYLRTNLSEDHPAYHYIMNPESDQAWKFVYWAYGGSVLGWAVYLVGTDSYFTKHIQSHAVPTQNAKHFASLTGFIKTLPFVETGRVVIFLSNANMTGAIHRDLAPSADVAPDEFIWMRTRTNKGFFVQDSESNEKYYVNSYAAWFNTTDYHGTDAAETASFSIRVDGVFTDEFRAKINEPA